MVDGAGLDAQLHRQVTHAHLAIALLGEQGQRQMAVFQVAGAVDGGAVHDGGPRGWQALAL
ncbi:hypothetical protein FQZ97_1132180 [compost metagenome]